MSEQPSTDFLFCGWCQRSRRSQDHWFQVGPPGTGHPSSATILRVLDPQKSAWGEDACGEECALKLASRLLRQGAEVAA